jgi:hypothetical protein
MGRQNVVGSEGTVITVPLRYGKVLQLQGNNDRKGHGYLPILQGTHTLSQSGITPLASTGFQIYTPEEPEDVYASRSGFEIT